MAVDSTERKAVGAGAATAVDSLSLIVVPDPVCMMESCFLVGRVV